MTQPNFDPIARPYRWLEYATLGPLLTRTRQAHLPALAACRNAYIVGDGDGRFTAALMRAHPNLHAQAVDTSAAMLKLLRANSTHERARLTTTQADARTLLPPSATDLVVTHFFLDCLTQQEVDDYIPRTASGLAPGALWLVSDFCIPSGLLYWPARLYVRLLYFAFRLVTGLRVTRLPEFASALTSAGFLLVAERRFLFGLLASQLWKRIP